jgi:LacI family transcriptional regulator
MTKRSHSITIRDVARQAGVSVATVSRFINRSTHISPEAAGRISQAMTELNYAPDAAARHLAIQKTRIIGLLLNSMNYEFFAPLMSGLEDVVARNGYNLLVATGRSGECSNSTPPIGPHNTDGMVIFSDTLGDEQLCQWHSMDFPVVLVYRTSPPSLSIPSVTIENKTSAQTIMDHLIDVHGKKRIIFMRGVADQEDSKLRESGYRASLDSHAIPYDPNLVLSGEFDREVSYQELSIFIAEKRADFDAVFCGDDDSAIGVIRALHEAGISVPGEVAVVGFDDLYYSSLLNPSLTTIQSPTGAVGRAAGLELFKLLHGQPAVPTTLLPTTLMIRQSCGCKASAQ